MHNITKQTIDTYQNTIKLYTKLSKMIPDLAKDSPKMHTKIPRRKNTKTLAYRKHITPCSHTVLK